MNLIRSAVTALGVCVWLSLAAGCGDTFSADYLQTIDENRDAGDVSAETSLDAPIAGDVPSAQDADVHVDMSSDAATADDGSDGVDSGPEETSDDAGGDTAIGEVSAG